MTLCDDLALFMIGRYTIRTVPCTVLTPYTGVVIMYDDTSLTDLDVRLCGTTDETCGVYTVVTAHRVKEHQGVRESPCLHLSDTTPFDICRVVVLLVTGHFTTATTYTGRGIEVKTVLFALTQVRDVDGVVSTLHPGVSLIVDKIL
jgi:hypothetical protein